MEKELYLIRSEYKNNKQTIKSEYKEKKKSFQEDYKSKLNDYYSSETFLSKANPPRRSLLEEIGNAVTHGVGSLFSIVALVLMLLSSDTPLEYVGASIYSFGLFVMFTMSCLYHSFRYGSKVKRLFRRFDYSSIYLLIGATFAPILLCYIGGVYGIVFVSIQWAIIITGITFIGVFGPTRLNKLHLVLYIILGWSALLLVPKMITENFFLFLFIISGGIVYSLGIIPFKMNKKVSHFLWHFFVLAGAVTQWLGIYFFIYLI